MSSTKQHVFLVGAKSLGSYGGYETFVNKLTEYHSERNDIQYHVACKANGDGCMDESTLKGVSRLSESEFIYHNAHCFKIRLPKIGSAQAIIYDIKALDYCCSYIQKHEIKNPIVYIMACRIGPWIGKYRRKIHALGGRLFLNPDGHEWKRAKWSAPIKRYWKNSESRMVRNSDLVICDSVNIEKYIHSEYDGKCKNGRNPRTTFIAYGAETKKSKLSDTDKRLLKWYETKKLSPKGYYLVVGRFVPENNYETMIKEFMKTDIKKDFAIITNINDKFLDQLENTLHYRSDPRIKFVGTVYDEELLRKIRENAYAYFHGHEVGGTNPSLLEALGSTDVNLLLDVGFNKEVACDAALYWSKQDGSLSSLIMQAEKLTPQQIAEMSEKAKQRIRTAYSWDHICDRYASVFLDKKYFRAGE